jgi:hypothetical protein
VSAAEGRYRPSARDVLLRLRLDSAPGRVHLGTEALSQVDTSKAGVKGWSRSADGVVTVRVPDRFEAFRVAFEP